MSTPRPAVLLLTSVEHAFVVAVNGCRGAELHAPAPAAASRWTVPATITLQPCKAKNHQAEQADGAGAGQQNPFTGNTRAEFTDGLKGCGERLGDGRLVERNGFRKLVALVLANDDELRERAADPMSHAAADRAEHVVALPAVLAGAADHRR